MEYFDFMLLCCVFVLCTHCNICRAVRWTRKTNVLSENRNRLMIDGNLIRKVDETKFLGVLIDKDISWRGHIGKVLTRVRQTMGIIGRARGFMNGPQLLLLYNTMVLPHLQYCLLNWGNFKRDGNSGLRGGLVSLQKS